MVDLELEQVEAVAGKANLLESQRGATIQVSVRRDLLGEAVPGTRLRCRAKRTPDGAMCEAHPAQEDFAILEGGGEE